MSLVVGAQYKLGNKLGSGAFGEIYAATNSLTGQEVAVKLEPLFAKNPQLAYEARVYERMHGKPGIPSIYYFGKEGSHYILVMDRLGQNLEELFTKCGRRFSMQTTLLLADQMLTVLEQVHNEGFIHRDLKPDNFLIGCNLMPSEVITLPRRFNQSVERPIGRPINTAGVVPSLGANVHQPLVYLVDFGLSKCFWNPDTNTHIPYRKGKYLTGTPRYASIRNHKGCEQSRRDDLESIGYILIYFLLGNLPWQNMTGKTKQVRYKKMMELKETVFPNLLKTLPPQFKTYFKMIFLLQFTETPNYKMLRNLFRQVYNAKGYSNENIRYDWEETQ